MELEMENGKKAIVRKLTYVLNQDPKLPHIYYCTCSSTSKTPRVTDFNFAKKTVKDKKIESSAQNSSLQQIQ